ncbi:MAG: hypothetical protein BVN35_17655 [Proteobacteria bacterium ST_bin11]|nr:MAG: hypothetical protein BVN35_17655 [Proteobacteria bacterium ST_bin11]
MFVESPKEIATWKIVATACQHSVLRTRFVLEVTFAGLQSVFVPSTPLAQALIRPALSISPLREVAVTLTTISASKTTGTSPIPIIQCAFVAQRSITTMASIATAWKLATPRLA